MLGQIFQPAALLAALGLGVLGFIIGLIVGAIAGEGGKALVRGAETALLCVIGGIVARSFIGGVLALGGAEPGDGLAVGWFFFLWPGLVDSITTIFGARPLTNTTSLLWIAMVVGCLAGLFDGLWRIHKWKGPGILTFLVDMTWGLPGTSLGVLLHLVNFAWGDHVDERRTGVHRYEKGFRLKSDFAFTQGSVMSNMDEGPGTGLYAHERVHVLQNRIFGPLYIMTHVIWMAVMFIPGLIAGATSSSGTLAGVMQLTYYNNPWEAWAFHVGHKHGDPARTSWGKLIWKDAVVGIVSIPMFALALGLIAMIVALTWF